MRKDMQVMQPINFRSLSLFKILRDCIYIKSLSNNDLCAKRFICKTINIHFFSTILFGFFFLNISNKPLASLVRLDGIEIKEW